VSQVNGQLVRCDRCGKTIFLKHLGEGSADGGYTRWDKFEPLPEGWGSHLIPTVKMLCPKCNGEYRSLIDSFMPKNTKIEDGWWKV